MKNFLIALGAGALMLAAPASAQDEAAVATTLGMSEEESKDFAKFMEAFKPEPLTAEEEARLPLARQVMALSMPDGVMAETFGSLFGDLLGPIMELEGDSSRSDAVELLGYFVEFGEADEEKAREIVLIVDPARKEREKAEFEAINVAMTKMMEVMEAPVREAMSKAYAREFTSAELTDILGFMKTPSGAAFAEKSYRLVSDPKVFMSVFESLPEMMGPIMEAAMAAEAASAQYGQPRGYDDLTASERARLRALSGLNDADLRAALEAGASDVLDMEVADEGDEAAEEDGGAWDDAVAEADADGAD